MSFVVEKIKRRIPLSKPAPAAMPRLTDTDVLETLTRIGDQARSLRPPLNNKPDQWHEDKSELISRIDRLCDRFRFDRRL